MTTSGADPRDTPCLLTMPSYSGSLAAARCLGARGVPVTVAGASLLAPARWSRYVTEVVRCPEPRDIDRFVEWLLAFGDSHPGYVLYPTCDDLAWLFAAHAPALRERFLLWQPPVESIVQLLDKQRLYATCTNVGIDTVPTWFPTSLEDVGRLAGQLDYPLLIKPRTQVMLTSLDKGRLALDPDMLLERFKAFTSGDAYLPHIRGAFGDLTYPMLQTFCPQAIDGIYALAGFADRTGRIVGVRASRKVLQRPRMVGVGLAFEGAPVDTLLVRALERLCQAAGYFGVFEAEFIADGSRWMLIDFNPRFYGQMAFEHARGLPLAYIAWLSARGEDREAERVAVEGCGTDGNGWAYASQWSLKSLMRLRRWARSISLDEYEHWRDWFRTHEGRVVDATSDPSDRLPGFVHAVADVKHALRHPRAYLNNVFDRS